MSRIYLDHNATSPLRPEAREAMTRALAQVTGNASSLHAYGRSARRVVESAREEVARLIGALPEEIVLTSGGTESNNLAIHGAARRAGVAAGRFVTSAIEHPSVLGPLEDLEGLGFEVARVRPTREGRVEPGAILEAAGESASFVSLMLANNEVGALQPVAEVGRELRRRNILFHCDASQAAGKTPIDVRELGVGLLSLAGHKFGAPQGVGVLYVRRGLALHPLLQGGRQEINRRPGTENVAAIAGLGAAATAAARDLRDEGRRQADLRDSMERDIQGRLPGTKINGLGAPRVPNTSSLAFEGVSGETLVIALDLDGVAVSAGSACSAGTMRKSHVLAAMGLEDESVASIRVSLGPTTTAAEVRRFIEILERVVDRARSAAAGMAAGRGA